MKYIVQLVFPSLGKIDKCITLDQFKDTIEVPLVNRFISPIPIDPIPDDMVSTERIKRMIFVFTGKQEPQGFEPDYKRGGFMPTSMLCEFAFNGIRE